MSAYWSHMWCHICDKPVFYLERLKYEHTCRLVYSFCHTVFTLYIGRSEPFTLFFLNWTTLFTTDWCLVKCWMNNKQCRQIRRRERGVWSVDTVCSGLSVWILKVSRTLSFCLTLYSVRKPAPTPWNWTCPVPTVWGSVAWALPADKIQSWSVTSADGCERLWRYHSLPNWHQMLPI